MGFKMFGLCALAHAVVLLTVSYFVLYSVRNLEKERGLKVFGFVVAALLWLAALTAFSMGAYKLSKGGMCPMGGMMKARMQGAQPQSQGQMMK